MDRIVRHIGGDTPPCITLLQRVAGASNGQLRVVAGHVSSAQRAQLDALADEIPHDAREIELTLIDAFRHTA